MTSRLHGHWLMAARALRARLDCTRACLICGHRGHGVLGPVCDAEVVERAEARGILTLGSYDSALGEHVRRLKFHDETHLAGPLGRALSARHDKTLRGVVLVPIPLHPLRLAERGYNQSALVARALGRASGIPVDTSALVRSAATEHQVGKDARARSENLRGAFSVTGRAAALTGARIALVDDVHTTGATLAECERTLVQVGLVVALRIVIAVAE